LIKTASQQKMKQINARSVFQLIQTYKQIPRVQLAKLTKLSRTTISMIVEEMMEKGLVVERSIMESTNVGRPAIKLEVNDSLMCIIGVELSHHGVSGTVLNLKNEPVLTVREDFRGTNQDEDVLGGIIRIVRQLIEATEQQFKKLLAICVSAPAILDRDKKSIIYSTLFKLENTDLHSQLKREFDVPIYIENETLLSALAEREHNPNKSSPFIYVSINEGLGVSVIIDDWTLEGANKSLLEIGHMSLDINGELCACGNRGCFELSVSILGLVRLVKTHLPDYKDSLIHGLVLDNSDRIDETVILEAAKASDPLALFVVEQMGANLGKGLVNLIHIFNPATIVIGGRLSVLGDELLVQVRNQVSSRALKSFSQQCEIVLSATRGNVSSTGASIYALNKVLDTLIQ
jgi:predicted NBD/HSP70 family sugar kinase